MERAEVSQDFAWNVALIREYIGDRAFFAALARETPAVQRALKHYLYFPVWPAPGSM